MSVPLPRRIEVSTPRGALRWVVRARWLQSQVGAWYGEHAIPLAIIGTYTALACFLHALGAAPDALTGVLRPETYVATVALVLYSAGVIAALHCCGFIGRHRSGWRAAWAAARRGPLRIENILRVLMLCLALRLFLNVVDGLKASIPLMHPFSWDARLADAGQQLFGGVPAWALLQPLLGHPPVTRALDALYMLWFPITTGILLWQAWSSPAPERTQFFVAFTLVWVVLGTALATMLSSAGPCYFGLVVPDRPDPYAPLMRYLHDVDARAPLMAVSLQNGLWDAQRHGLPAGISAMPSLHVSLCTLFVLTGRQARRWLGWVLFVYAALVYVAGIHLGWHYALDGLVGALGSWAIWCASGWLVRRAVASRRAALTIPTAA
jgi:hypothetical protein